MKMGSGLLLERAFKYTGGCKAGSGQIVVEEGGATLSVLTNA